MAITRIGGANAITGTIPQGNIANASLGAVTALPGAIATGKILQIINSTNGSNASTSTQSYVSYLTATITPSSTSNKIFIVFSGNGYANTKTIQVALFRGGVESAGGTRLNTSVVYNGSSSSTAYQTQPLGLSDVDSPSTTNAQTYTIGFRPVGGDVYAQIGEAGYSTVQNLTLMEIAG